MRLMFARLVQRRQTVPRLMTSPIARAPLQSVGVLWLTSQQDIAEVTQKIEWFLLHSHNKKRECRITEPV